MATAPGRGAPAGTGQVFFYFGALTLLVYLATPTGYLFDIPTSYILKNQLHATATQVSTFRLLGALPVYFAFVFGLARDLWSPFGLRDRGFFLTFAPVTGIVFIWMALFRLSYVGLLIGTFLVMLSTRFIMAAYQGLIALIGQEQLMSGRLATLWLIFNNAPTAAGAFASGYVTEHLAPHQIFVIMAVLVLLIACLGLWKPRAVFLHAYDRPQAKGTNFLGDIKRLVRHRAIYPPVLIYFLWSFSPGSSTPLQFHLTNRLHASDAVFSYYTGIFQASFIPAFLLYGFLCKRVSLKKLLWWGTFIAVPQMIPLAFVHSGNMALLVAIPEGLMGGIATAAYFDLAMRSCPPGLQGTLMMLFDGLSWFAFRGGDVVGSWIYNSSPEHGFQYCVLAVTSVYALMLPLILLVPKQLIATADGEPNPALDAEMLAEIAESDPV